MHSHAWRGTGILVDGIVVRECVHCYAFEDEHPKVRDDFPRAKEKDEP